MKLDTFFDKFELFADAPNAVQKMRELVLDLAVKGKLTDQDIAKEVVDSKYSKEPTSDVLPPNWRLLNFGKFCDIQGGNQPPKSQFSDTPKPGYVRMFQIRDLGERPVPTYISIESTNRFCSDGEILIGRYGASVGKIFWAQDGAYNVALAKFLYPDSAFVSDFAFWVLKSDFFQSEIAGASRSAQAGFNKGDLASINFPLPPLAEQKRIVAKVDELMALCDRLEAQQQQRAEKHSVLARAAVSRFADAPTPTNLDFIFHNAYAITPADLRKTILTLAVQGKLVPQDEKDEPAQMSIDRVARDAMDAMRAGIIRRRELGDITGDSTSSDLPTGWRWSRLVEVTRPVPFSIKRGPFGSAIRKDMFVPTGFKVYEQQHAISGDFTKGRYYINQAKFEELNAFELHPNEILISCSGTVGKVAVVPPDIERGIINQALLKLSLHQSAVLNEYFLILFPAFFMETDTLTNLSGTAQKNIPGMDVLKAMPFPLPPLAEQKRIVAKVDELMKLVDQLETQLATASQQAEQLMNAIVAELTALRGLEAA